MHNISFSKNIRIEREQSDSKYDTNFPRNSYLNSKYELFWVITHTTTVLCIALQCMYPQTGFSSVSYYKLAVYSSLFTYGTVIYKQYLSEYNINQTPNKGSILFFQLFKTENAQLFMHALLGLVTKESICKLFSFGIYSILNLSSFLLFDVFPNTSFTIAAGPLFLYFEIPMLTLAAYMDIFVIGVLTKESFSNKMYSWIFLYLYIWVSKLENSAANKSALFQLLNLFLKFSNEIMKLQKIAYQLQSYINSLLPPWKKR